jgi:hypothetical protein
MYCPSCGEQIPPDTLIPLPCSPMWDIPTVAALLVVSEDAIRCTLYRHKDKFNLPVYRRRYNRARKRVLTSEEVRTLISIINEPWRRENRDKL